MNHEELYPIFFGTWIVLAIFSYLVFYSGKNVARKRKLWRPFISLVGIMVVAFMYILGSGIEALYVMVPAVILMVIYNFCAVQFCECGHMDISQNPFSKSEYCSKCGEKYA